MNSAVEPADTTCAQCGVRSPFALAFRQVKRRRRTLTLCPACNQDEIQRDGKVALVGVAIWFVLGALVVAAAGDRANAGWVLLNLTFLHVAFWITTIPHELGHALAAKAMGLKVYRIVLGTGRRLASLTLGEIAIDVLAIPIGGLTYVRIRDQCWLRLKWFVVTAGGPLVDIATLYAILHFARDAWTAERFGRGFAPLTVLVAALVIDLVMNLWPRRGDTHAGRAYTDGAQLLRLLMGRKLDAEAASRATAADEVAVLAGRQTKHAIEVGRAALQEHPNDDAIRIALSAALLNDYRFAEGRNLLLTMTGNEYPGVEGVVCNNLAWANLHLDDDALVPEARAMSSRAHELMPWERYVISTRGCVEALHGDATFAVQLLTSERVRTSEKVRASTFSALAAAYSRLGRVDDSQRALTLAAQADSACPLLAIVRRRFANLDH